MSRAWLKDWPKRSWRALRRIDRRTTQEIRSEDDGLVLAMAAGAPAPGPGDEAAWRRLRGLGDLARRRLTRAAAEMRKRLEGKHAMHGTIVRRAEEALAGRRLSEEEM